MRPLLLAALLSLAPAAQAAPACTDGITPRSPGKFCDNVEDCMTFCSCACTFDATKWKSGVKNDGSTTCPGLSETGVGMLARDSAELRDLTALPHITFRAGTRATQDVIDGLRRLSEHLEASPERIRLGYTVHVKSCYRSHLTDTVPECGFVLKAKHMLAKKDLTEEKRAYWLDRADPRNLGLAWPGRTPHSGGYACDLILLDAAGRDCFDWRAGVPGTPTCSIAQKTASSIMDEAATNPTVGARRLRYEAWHFEWGPSAAGCVHPDCGDKHWPPTGRP